jgi:hypothetical protein
MLNYLPLEGQGDKNARRHSVLVDGNCDLKPVGRRQSPAAL